MSDTLKSSSNNGKEDSEITIAEIILGCKNGLITSSLNMNVDELMWKFNGFSDIKLSELVDMCKREVHLIWQWNNKADENNRFTSWNEMTIQTARKNKLYKKSI